MPTLRSCEGIAPYGVILDLSVYFQKSVSFEGILHSQLLKLIILKFNSPVLLNLLGNNFRIAKLSEQYGESTLPILISQENNDGIVIKKVCIVTGVSKYDEI